METEKPGMVDRTNDPKNRITEADRVAQRESAPK